MGVLNWMARRMLGMQRRRKDDPFWGGRVGSAYIGAARGSGTQDWLAMSLSADAANQMDLQALRDRSHDLVRNNDHARQFVRLVADNVVGSTGIQLQVQVKTKSGTPNKKANDAIEEVWKEWSRTCEITGRSMWHVQWLCARSWAESGEVFIRLHRTGDGVPWRLQVIEAQRIDLTYMGTPTSPNHVWKQGIELDDLHRPTRYALLRYDPTDRTLPMQQSGQPTHELVPADQIIHLFHQERPEQTRGVPMLYSSIATMRQLGEYVRTEMIRARGASSLMGFVHDIESDGGALGVAGAGEDGNPASDIETETWRPGTFRRLGPGETITVPQMQAPTGQYDPFVRSLLRSIAAGVGSSYEALSRDYSKATYSSGRLSLLQDRDTWRGMQRIMIEQFCEPVYRRWLPDALMVANLPRAQKNVAARYWDHQWQTRGWQWVDPQKDVQAHLLAVQAGFRSISDVVSETGQDLETVLAQRARELALLEELGVPVSSTPSGAPAPAAPSESSDGDEDETADAISEESGDDLPDDEDQSDDDTAPDQQQPPSA